MAGHICGHVTGPGPEVLNDLDDVDTVTTPPVAGSYLVYNGSMWVVGDLGSIDGHTDVDTTTAAPTVGQVLKWDGSNWVPSPDAGAGILDTDDLPEGTVNLYYTDARVQEAVDDYFCSKFSASCFTLDAVGHAVRVVNTNPTVTRVDPDLPNTMPAIGIIVNKPNIITCEVVTFGCVDITGLGLTASAGDRIWVDHDSTLTNTLPVPVSGTRVLQLIGYMRTDTELMVRPELTAIKVVR